MMRPEIEQPRWSWLNKRMLLAVLLVCGILALIGLFVYHRLTWYRTITITDVSQPITLNLEARTQDYFPTGFITFSQLTIFVTGDIDGEIEFLPFGRNPQVLSGNVDVTISADYFNSKATLVFRPKGFVQGQLKVRYWFR